MMIFDFILVVQLWAITFLIGLASFPVTAFFFADFKDKGYAFGKIVGLVVVSFLLLLFVTAGILPLSFASCLMIFGLWALINFIVQIRFRAIEKVSWMRVVRTELIFLVLATFLVFVKGHQPEIYQIERFMDFGFIKALFNTQKLPLFDIWMAGKSLNYYYFGHLMAYVLISFLQQSVPAGFFLVEAWIFGALGGAVFELAGEIYRAVFPKGKAAWVCGSISLFCLLFAGTWHTIWQQKGFWYAEPTRIIHGTITEIPIYTFLVAELHAHMWGLVVGVVLLGIIFSVWQQKKHLMLVRQFYLLPFFLGIALMTNSWDLITLGAMALVVMGIKLFQRMDARLLACGVAFTCIFIWTIIPWTYYFKSPVAGVGLVQNRSPMVDWFLFWGGWAFLEVVFLLKLGVAYFRGERRRIGFIVLVVMCSFIWLGLVEIFYLKDILSGGEWVRANTVFKVSMQVWLWLAVVSGPILIYVVTNKRFLFRAVLALMMVAYLFSLAIYPAKAIFQATLEGRQYSGISSGLDWWQRKLPDDYAAYQFLEGVRKNLPENDRVKVIMEADGESYADSSFFSTFLGWPTISGWAVHEWTWRGSFDEVGKRVEEIREIYTGNDFWKTEAILRKYGVSYVVICSAERKKFGGMINFSKLQSMGKVGFKKGECEIVEVKDGI